MIDTTERTYTLAEVRAAYVHGARDGHMLAPGYAEVNATILYPDPEPPEPERPTVEHGDWRYRISADGKYFEEQYRQLPSVWHRSLDVPLVLALASLLPRVPVTVTEEMVRKAAEAYAAGNPMKFVVHSTMRAALSAVVADLAQPVHACQHKPTPTPQDCVACSGRGWAGVVSGERIECKVCKGRGLAEVEQP